MGNLFNKKGIRLQHNGFVCFQHLLKSNKELQSYSEEEVRFVAWTSKYVERYQASSRFHLERSKGKESIRWQVPYNHDKVITATKYWHGVSTPSRVFNTLSEMASEIGNGGFSDPHFTFGWCAITDEFAAFATNFRMEEKLKEVCVHMAKELYFVNTGFEFIGRDEDKLAIIFSPFTLEGEEDNHRYLQYDYHFKVLWRLAAQSMAKQKNAKFSYFTNHTGALEFGEIGGQLVYQMRSIKPKYHITLGRAAKGQEESLDGYELEITINPKTFYLEAGAPCKLKVGY